MEFCVILKCLTLSYIIICEFKAQQKVKIFRVFKMRATDDTEEEKYIESQLANQGGEDE